MCSHGFAKSYLTEKCLVQQILYPFSGLLPSVCPYISNIVGGFLMQVYHLISMVKLTLSQIMIMKIVIQFLLHQNEALADSLFKLQPAWLNLTSLIQSTFKGCL